MDVGYFSKQAVQDMLAVKEGEIIYLRKKVKELEQRNAELSNSNQTVENVDNYYQSLYENQ